MSRKAPIRYLSTAQRDIADIIDYLKGSSHQAALDFVHRLDSVAANLSQFLDSGSVPRDQGLKRKGYRMVVMGQYLLFYKHEANRGTVYRVIHGARRYRFLLR